MEEMTKFKKGFYVTSMHRVYNNFMRDRLLSNYYRSRYDTYEEAIKNTQPGYIEDTYEIHYTDGLDNWFHCSSCGHDKYTNNLIIKRLHEGDTDLTVGYYVVWNQEGKEYSENPFEHTYKGYTYRYYNKQFGTLEEALEEIKLYESENGEKTSTNNNNLSDYSDSDDKRCIQRLYYVSEYGEIKEISPQDVLPVIKTKTQK